MSLTFSTNVVVYCIQIISSNSFLTWTSFPKLLAYQFGFDLVNDEVQKFIQIVQQTLPVTEQTSESTLPAVL